MQITMKFARYEKMYSLFRGLGIECLEDVTRGGVSVHISLQMRSKSLGCAKNVRYVCRKDDLRCIAATYT